MQKIICTKKNEISVKPAWLKLVLADKKYHCLWSIGTYAEKLVSRLIIKILLLVKSAMKGFKISSSIFQISSQKLISLLTRQEN